jgi:leucyl-tRNA synthetase
MYMGGIEHVRRHHLYARFVTMVLHDQGLLDFAEPFTRLRLHGLLDAIDPASGQVAKMSKSKGNVVTPDEYIARFGADVLRLALLFAGPYEEGGAFREVRDATTGEIRREGSIAGIVRFLERCYDLVAEHAAAGPSAAHPGASANGAPPAAVMHRTIKQVGEDVADLKFHTAIARLMEYSTWLKDNAAALDQAARGEHLKMLTLLLAPLAPHLAEEMWATLGQPYSVHQQSWPAYDEAQVQAHMTTLVVQVNGKLRERAAVPATISQDEAHDLALRLEKVRQALAGKKVTGVIFVPGRLINIVAR